MILLLLNHAILSVLYLYGFIDYSLSFKITGRRLFYPLILHIIISMYLYFKTRNIKKYSNLISETTQQIITGVFIILFATLHILSYMILPIDFNFNFSLRLLHLIIDILLFISIILHLQVSIPRLLISFGFLENKNSYKNFKEKFNIFILIVIVILIFAEITHYMVFV